MNNGGEKHRGGGRLPRGRSMYVRREGDARGGGNRGGGGGGGGMRRGNSFVHNKGNGGGKGSWRRGASVARMGEERVGGGNGGNAEDRDHHHGGRPKVRRSFYGKKGGRSFYNNRGRKGKGDKDASGEEGNVGKDNGGDSKGGRVEEGVKKKEGIKKKEGENVENMSDAHAAFLRMSGLDHIPIMSPAPSLTTLDAADMSNVTSPASTDQSPERNMERERDLKQLTENSKKSRHQNSGGAGSVASKPGESLGLPLSATSSVSVDLSEGEGTPSHPHAENDVSETKGTITSVEAPEDDDKTNMENITHKLGDGTSTLRNRDPSPPSKISRSSAGTGGKESIASQRDLLPSESNVQARKYEANSATLRNAIGNREDLKSDKTAGVPAASQRSGAPVAKDTSRDAILSISSLEIPQQKPEATNLMHSPTPSTPGAMPASGKWCESCAGLGLQIAALVAENEKSRLAEAESSASPSPAPSKKGWKLPDAFKTKVLGVESKGSSEKARLRQEIDVLRATVDFLYRKLDAVETPHVHN